MLTARELAVCRAILTALKALPEDMPCDERTLHADAARIAHPRATTLEIENGIRYLDTKRRMAGIAGETGMLWQITDAGRLWLGQNA